MRQPFRGGMGKPGTEVPGPGRRAENFMSPAGTARFLFVSTRNFHSPLAFAIANPKKIYFGNFFRSRYRTSTRHVRVLSRSRWTTIYLKENSEQYCENF